MSAISDGLRHEVGGSIRTTSIALGVVASLRRPEVIEFGVGEELFWAVGLDGPGVVRGKVVSRLGAAMFVAFEDVLAQQLGAAVLVAANAVGIRVAVPDFEIGVGAPGRAAFSGMGGGERFGERWVALRETAVGYGVAFLEGHRCAHLVMAKVTIERG